MVTEAPGAYLAAQVAASESDYAAAAAWYARAMLADADQPGSAGRGGVANIGIGDMGLGGDSCRAALMATGAKSQTATVALVAD